MPKGGKRENAGRKPGSLGKQKKELLERIEAEFPGYDPLISMIRYAYSLEDDTEERFLVDKEITPYMHGKRASVTVDGNMNLKIFKDYSSDARQNGD